MVINPTTSIGKLRLRCGDFMDLQMMPDSVYQSALDDNSGNLPRAAMLMAQYILASLTSQVHQKMGLLEVFGNQWFENYVAFIKLTILNPNLMQLAPIPFGAGSDVVHPLLQFRTDWNSNYVYGTQSDQLHLTALGGVTPPNNGFF